MATELISCNALTIEGIKSIKICTKLTNGNPIVFPTDFVLYQNLDGVIQISENPILQTITIGNQAMEYLLVDSYDMCEFEDIRRETRQGVWFEKIIRITLPKLLLYQTNQIIDFLFNVDGSYATAQCILAITDSLGQQYLLGYDIPAQVTAMDLQTDVYDTTDNQYKLELSSKSYSRLRRYVVV